MELLGSCRIQYAINLLKSKQLALRTNRERGDNPIVEIYSLPKESKLLLKILGDVRIEDMSSNPGAGAKSRSDFYFTDEHLDDLISILEPLVKRTNIDFDDAPRSTPDPTGMEHSSGLILGQIFNKYSTNLNATCIVRYTEKSFDISTTSTLYIDIELKRGKRFHMGINMQDNILESTNNINDFEIYINYTDIKRFLYSIKIAKKILEQQ